MSKIKLVTITFTLILFASCAGPYTYKDSGKTVELSVNDVFEIVLEGEPGSGYVWELDEPTSFVRLESISTENESGKDKFIFHFKAVAQGQETIFLEYSKEEAINKNFELKVVVGTLGAVL
ncbi:hypothetical protein EI546_03930 [Aequorivita sp. H23M31]|uniref:Proteinase inhibitor I42 chagasin domain-containing protein n=1 Tax=Aequorivita ciconiae TaxID=2494375 RepID=A0A410G108_9FLAO|nr:protease inhibitor I42 family protein [Aequorivita sp. H23M31]QAA80929.1 hypothetical protein EI546_03930 [Aequorivita sp. H23M31]